MSAPPEDFQAPDWFSHWRAADPDPRDEEPWLKWIGDVGHQKSYENCELAWQLSAELRSSPALTVLLAGADALVSRQRVAALPTARPKMAGAGLAGESCRLFCSPWARLRGCSSPTPRSLNTVRLWASSARWALADGSTVLLNTDSAVRVALSRNLRRIELSRGEALFSVSHDPSPAL